MKPEKDLKERRKYPRINRTFLVNFQVIDKNANPKSDIYNGITCNIAKGGMLIIYDFAKTNEMPKLLADKPRLKLYINIPQGSPPVESTAFVKWVNIDSSSRNKKVFFGVEYDNMDELKKNMIYTHVNRLRKKYKVFLYFALLFISLFTVFLYFLIKKH